MKSTFRILLFIMTITFCGVNAYAQKDNRQRMTREQLAETQAKYITKEMAMENAAVFPVPVWAHPNKSFP